MGPVENRLQEFRFPAQFALYVRQRRRRALRTLGNPDEMAGVRPVDAMQPPVGEIEEFRLEAEDAGTPHQIADIPTTLGEGRVLVVFAGKASRSDRLAIRPSACVQPAGSGKERWLTRMCS